MQEDLDVAFYHNRRENAERGLAGHAIAMTARPKNCRGSCMIEREGAMT
jgi:hypothetical protein